MVLLVWILFYLVGLRILSSSPVSPDCPECYSMPILLHDNTNGQLIQTSFIAHPGDDPYEIAREVCMAIASATMEECIQGVLVSLDEKNYMKRFQTAVTPSLRTSKTSMSRHEKLTILKRLRTFERPRRLLIIGADEADAMFWHTMNSRQEGGFTCFVARNVDPIPPPTEQQTSLSNTPTNTQPFDVLQLGVLLSEIPFVKVAYDVENSIIPHRIWAKHDLEEMGREIPSNYSFIPWDMVVLYDICVDVTEDDEEQASTNADADSVLDNRNNIHNNKDKSENQNNHHHNRRQTCSQKYLDYATDRTADDGYLFVQANLYQNHTTEWFLNEKRPNNKFMYRKDLSSHLGSQVPLRYYTNAEINTPTLAGQRQRTQSQSLTASNQLTSCVRDMFVHGYRRYLDSMALNTHSSHPSASQPSAEEDKLSSSSSSTSSLSTSSISSLRTQALALLQQRGYTRVIGVLFCCRKRYTSILQGYMQRNLRWEGGLLDHIMLYNYGTMNDDPLYPTWLATQPGFVERTECGTNTTFGCAYGQLGEVDPLALFVKFDDDLLFLSDGAIEALVIKKCLINGPSFVHGNGVNHLHTPFFHAIIDQEMESGNGDDSGTGGRSGGGNGDDTCGSSNGVSSSSNMCSTATNQKATISPTDKASHIDGVLPTHKPSDLSLSEHDWVFYGRDWQNPLKAQEQHNIFLQRMLHASPTSLSTVSVSSSTTSLDKLSMVQMESTWYWFDDINLSKCKCASPQPATGICSSQGYFRTSINLVCFSWDDVKDHIDLLHINDEIGMTVYIPERGGHQTIIAGRALYVHAAFTPQRESAVVGNLNERMVLQGYTQLAQRYLNNSHS